MRTLFRSHDYLRVWIGTLISTLGMEMQYVARGWFVFGIDDSVLDLAWVAMAFTLPQVFFSLPGGVLADRYSKRTIMAVAHLLNAGITVLLGLLILANHAGLLHFIVFGILNGTFLAVSFPSRQAIVPHLVDKDVVFSAVALNTTAVSVSRVAGPAIGGLLIYWISQGYVKSEFAVGLVYLIIAALYFFASVLSFFISVPGKADTVSSSTRPLQEALAAVKYVLHTPILSGLVLLSVFAYIFGHNLNTFIPAFNEIILRGDTRSYGFLLTTLGIGSIFGSFSIAWISRFRVKWSLLIGIQFLWGISILIFGQSSGSWLVFALIGIVGWLAGAGMALNRSLIQSKVDTKFLGRVMSLDMIAHGMMPLSAVPLGILADAMGVHLAISLSGGLLIATIALALLVFSVRRTADERHTS